MEVDHDNQEVYSETIQLQQMPMLASMLEPTEEEVAARLTSPIMTTFIDTDKIAFERYGCIITLDKVKGLNVDLCDYSLFNMNECGGSL